MDWLYLKISVCLHHKMNFDRNFSTLRIFYSCNNILYDQVTYTRSSLTTKNSKTVTKYVIRMILKKLEQIFVTNSGSRQIRSHYLEKDLTLAMANTRINRVYFVTTYYLCQTFLVLLGFMCHNLIICNYMIYKYKDID